MLIFKIIAIAMITLFVFLFFKERKAEISSLISMSFTIIILGMILLQLSNIITFIKEISEQAHIDTLYLGIVLKILAISFLCTFTNDICKDAGASNIGSRVEFAGKILILGLSIPILRALLEAVIKIL